MASDHSHGDHSHEHHDCDSHSHSHSHSHAHRHFDLSSGSRVVSWAIGITILFMIIEAVGGWFANSLALLSDSAHLLTDVGALILTLFAFWVSKKPRTPTMSFGYHRAEILSALASGLIIWLIAGFLVYEAVIRFQAPPEVNGPVVFVIATVGLLANLLSMRILKPESENLNVRAAYIHLFADSLGSIGAIVAGIVLWLTDWRPIDPIVTLVFSALMLMSSWELVKETVGILMESTPSHVDPLQVRKDLESIAGVQEAHDLHIWTVANGRLALSVHLISIDPDPAILKANSILAEKHGIIHTTIQVEHPDKFKSERCYDCQ